MIRREENNQTKTRWNLYESAPKRHGNRAQVIMIMIMILILMMMMMMMMMIIIVIIAIAGEP